MHGGTLLLVMLGGMILVALLVAGVLLASFLPLWIQAKATAIPVSLLDMACMRLRRVDPGLVVNTLVSLTKAGIPVQRAELEAQILSGGHLERVGEALISAHKAGLNVSFHQLAAIDLAGRDVLSAVNHRVNPRVLVCPPPNSKLSVISGVCQDGVRLGVRARITVRTNLERLVGGAGEETVLARVGEGIVGAIGRAASHKEILSSPETITGHLLDRGLDSGTCFEILSVDIAGVDVMDNVGARLQSFQAETDKKIAQARAEIRRAAAVAVQQEMRAETLKSQSNVVMATATLPLASASAFRESNIGVPRPWSAPRPGRLPWQWWR